MIKSTTKLFVTFCVALVMALSLLGVMTLAASAADGIAYVDHTWDEESGKLTSATGSVTEYTEVSSDTKAWTAGWYVVSGEITVAERITVTGDVHLVLTDNCTLTAQKGITVTGTDSLTIYGQAEGSGKLDATGENYCAGIGGNRGDSGNITINGSTVTANGGNYGAGIGGGDKGNGGIITINGGTVTATGNIVDPIYGSAGIGGGYQAEGGIITINGGNVTANGGYEGAGIGGGEAASGGTIIINGGEITANSGGSEGASAAIGGGRTGSGGNITINGGTVTATTFGNGAAIGGGREADGGNITINGGTVTVKYDESNTNVSFGAGIGGGYRGTSGTIEITGGDVTAKGYGSAPGIGGQRGDDTDTVIIRGGTVTATSVVDRFGNNGAAIGGATSSDAIPDIAIYGGTVTATGGANAAGIGGGRYGDGGKVTVTGGSVYAVGGSGAEAIGHGVGSTSSGTLTNGSENVRLVTIKIGSGDEISVNSIDAPEGYGLTDVETIDNVLYLYVPETVALPRVITAEDGTQYMGIASFDSTATFVAHTHNTNTTYYETTDAQHTLVSVCEGCPIEYMVKAEAEAHSIVYDASGNLLTAVCEKCGYTETVTLNAPATSTYDKTARTAFTDGAISGAMVSEIAYCCENGCINAGTHTAYVTVTVGDTEYTLKAEFDISPITLTVAGAEAYGRDYDGTDLIDIDTVLLDGIFGGDDVYVDMDALTAKLPSADAGDYYKVNLSGLALVGGDAQNYVLASTTAENVSFKDYYGYDSYITVYPLYIYITAEDQTVALNGALDQTKYALDEYSSLVGGHSISSVKLSCDTSVSTDFGSVTASDAMIVDADGNDVTANYEIRYISGRLTVTCSDHDEFVNGFCTTCDGYEKPQVNDNGTPDEDWDDYYEIDNAGKLFWFAQYVNHVDSSAKAKLTDNIDVNPGYDFNSDGSYTGGESPRVWVPIGTSADGSYLVYTGSFDGNGYTVSGLYINNPEQSYIGLFGKIGYNPEITNVHIVNSYFSGKEYVGAIAGYAEINLSLSSAASDVTVKGNLNVGGLIGHAGAYSNIVNCFSLATVDSEYGGGLVGYSSAAINNCFTTASNAADNINSSYGGSFSGVYYLGDVDDGFDGTTAVTVEQLASGEIAYLLQAGVQPVDIYDDEWNYIETITPEIWGQLIDGDKYPVLGGEKVYFGYISCTEGATKVYTNNSAASDEPWEHDFTGEWQLDADGHWHICLNDGCNATDAKADHTYENGKCACGDEKVIKVEFLANTDVTKNVDSATYGEDLTVTLTSTVGKDIMIQRIYVGYGSSSVLLTDYTFENNVLTIPGKYVTDLIRIDAYSVVTVKVNLGGGKMTDEATANFVAIGAVFDEDGFTMKYPYNRPFGDLTAFVEKTNYTFAGLTLPDGSVYDYETPLTENTTFTVAWEHNYVKFLGATVTVGTDLSMNYYVYLGEGFTNATMTFVMSNGKSAEGVTGVYDEAKNIYIFTFDKLPPQTMGDTINATLKLGDEVLAELNGYSIKAYAQELLNDETSGDELLQLVSDMLHYGAAAQTYRNYKTNELVTDGVNGLLMASAAAPKKTDMTIDRSESETVGFTAVGVWFDYNNKIYVKLSAVEGVKLVVNGTAVDLTDTTYMTDAILATEFDKVFTFELYEDDTLVQTLTYNISSYVLAMKDSTNASMTALADALYAYGKSAEAYVATTSTQS